MKQAIQILQKHGAVVGAHLLILLIMELLTRGDRLMLILAFTSFPPIYLNHFVLIPRLLNKRRLWGYIGNVMLMLVLYLVMIYVLTWLLVKYNVVHNFNPYKLTSFFDKNVFGITLFYCFMVVVMGLVTSIIRLMADSMSVAEMRERITAVENEKVAAELNGLKSQINPHFFFNALNSIYALSLDASPQTPSYILKLSGLMRYVLYECNQPFVALSKEVDFLRAYIDLQRIRLSERYSVAFEVDIDNEDQPVAPLIFLPLVENCFKHGLCESTSSAISISLSSSGGTIRFTTENPCNSSVNMLSKAAEGRIGYNNVVKRLDLIYPNRHKIRSSSDNSKFTTEIEIQI